jgi:hypothetical protein
MERDMYICPECERGDNAGGECPRCGGYMMSTDEREYSDSGLNGFEDDDEEMSPENDYSDFGPIEFDDEYSEAY